MVTLLLYFLFNIAGSAILDFGEDFFARNKLEDAHFSTYMPIPGKELSDLEEKYGIVLEAQRYINIETGDVAARVFERTKKVDLYEVTEGRDVVREDEIVISEGYADANGVGLGSNMKIGGKSMLLSVLCSGRITCICWKTRTIPTKIFPPSISAI